MRKTIMALALVLAAPLQAETISGSTDLLNTFRSEYGRKAVRYNPRLQATAEAHARDMARNGFFSHTGSRGSNIGQRARANGYRYCLVAENIAWGQRSLTQVMREWGNSPGHKKNMLKGKAREFGLARARDPRRGNIWVMVVGRSGC